MKLGDYFSISDYSKYYNFAMENGYTIYEVEPYDNGARRFQVSPMPEPTEDDILQSLRTKRELECFTIINRGVLWYNTLTEEQRMELDIWYKAWLDVTETKVIPEKPYWLN